MSGLSYKSLFLHRNRKTLQVVSFHGMIIISELLDPFRCPPGWKRHDRLCYYFSPAVDTKDWVSADKECEKNGANLAYIGSSAVESFIIGPIIISYSFIVSYMLVVSYMFII